MMRYNSQSLSWKTSLLVSFFFSVANTLEKVCTTWTMSNKDISYNCETAVEQIKVVHRNQPCPLWYQNSSDSCGHRHRTSHGNMGGEISVHPFCSGKSRGHLIWSGSLESKSVLCAFCGVPGGSTERCLYGALGHPAPLPRQLTLGEGTAFARVG